MRTETVRVNPPAAMLAPRLCPDHPAVPDTMDVGDLVRWYESYIAALVRSQAQSEADKAAVLDWCRNSERQ